MRYFLVEVFPDRTEVREFVHPLARVEIVKIVDGVEYRYSVKGANTLHPADKLWKARAHIQIDYHVLSGCTSIGCVDFWPDKRMGQLITTEKTDLWDAD